jgi:hypothetical protein
MSDEYRAKDESENYDKDLATVKKAVKNSKVRKRIYDFL